MDKNIHNERYRKANETLDIISSLENNWNNNGASSFSKEFVNKCRYIVNQLIREPFIAPTACVSIQLEYEENGDYLEFEMFDDKIEVFLHTDLHGDKEFNLSSIAEVDEMNKIITEFYN